MTSGHVFIAASLDGFIARCDDSIDWLTKQKTEGEDHGFDAFMDSVEGLVLGRASFQKVLTFGEWPYRKPVVVLSNSLTEAGIPENLRGRVRISGDEPRDIMSRLASEGWKRAYVDGGKVVQSFLANDLIEDITLTRIPILLGDGKPLFGPLEHDIDLEHVETRTFDSGLVTTKYRVTGFRPFRAA